MYFLAIRVIMSLLRMNILFFSKKVKCLHVSPIFFSFNIQHAHE